MSKQKTQNEKNVSRETIKTDLPVQTMPVIAGGKSYELACPQLAENLVLYQKALADGRSAVWTQAIALSNIVSQELYKKHGDFNDLSGLCKAFDISEKTVNKYCYAVSFKALQSNISGINDLSVNSVLALRRLYNKGKLVEFINWLAETKDIKSFEGMSENRLTELKNEFSPKAEEPKAEEPKAEEPKAEEPKAEEPKADIIFQGVRYSIPLSVLAEYEVENVEEEEAE